MSETPQPPPLQTTPLQTTPAQTATIGYCRACGKALDAASAQSAYGTIYCKEHVPMEETAQGPASPYTASPYTASPYTASPYSAAPPPVARADVSPGLAFLLGLIPGVGAIYNSQYIKGLVHVGIIGLLISILSNDAARGFEPLVGLMLAAFWWYMAFEAYHTANKRRQGQRVEEFSSVIPMGGSRFPAAPLILITLGIIFLLNNLGLFELRQALRYWPLLLIGLGVYMLYLRMSGPKDPVQ